MQVGSPPNADRVCPLIAYACHWCRRGGFIGFSSALSWYDCRWRHSAPNARLPTHILQERAAPLSGRGDRRRLRLTVRRALPQLGGCRGSPPPLPLVALRCGNLVRRRLLLEKEALVCLASTLARRQQLCKRPQRLHRYQRSQRVRSVDAEPPRRRYSRNDEGIQPVKRKGRGWGAGAGGGGGQGQGAGSAL